MGRQHGEIMQLSLSADFKDVKRRLDVLSTEMQQRVASAALNKVAPKARTAMARQITSEFKITQSEVRPRLRIKPATRSIDGWYVIIDPFGTTRGRAAKGTTLNLIRFVEKSISLAEAKRRMRNGEGGTYQLNKNVTRRKALQLRFQVKRGGKKFTLDGAFIATSRKTGGTAVFTRVGKERFPIEAKQTIDVPQMFNTRRIQAEVLKVIRRELPIEFNRAIKAAMSGVFR